MSEDAITDAPLRAGGQLGPFRLIRPLGEGGYGEVWEAEDERTGRRLALKVLIRVRAESPEARERFLREGRLAASLNHPSSVYLFGAEEVDGRPVISMELMKGGTLRDRLNEGRLTVTEAVDFTLDLIDGLEAAATAGIIHRDVKPSNCFLDESGEAAKIGDYGISKSLEAPSDLSEAGDFIGSPYYASPEQILGEPLDFSTDLYSLGVTLYELITGRMPFEGEAIQVAAMTLTKEPPPPSTYASGLSKGLDRIVLRMLAKEKDRRYESYPALREALIPFSSQRMESGDMGRRFGAIFVDLALVMTAQILGATFWPWMKDQDPFVIMAPYFLFTEYRWARSPGKLLFGLRVGSSDGSPMSFRSAVVRTAVLVGIPWLSWLLLYALPPGLILPPEMTSLYWPLLFGACLSMRRTNGYAGVHELLSRTRVTRAAGARRFQIPSRPPLAGHLQQPVRSFGPYRVTGKIWEVPTRALLTGRDDLLHRDVWIHYSKEAQSEPFPRRLLQGRPGRLWWLQGSRDEELVWNAYGAPTGTSFRDWVGVDGPRPWEEVRHILLMLMHEVRICLEEGEAHPGFSVDRLWIDASGDPKALEFQPFPRSTGGRAETLHGSPDWRLFLREVFSVGLGGAASAEPGADPGMMPFLPEHTRPFVDRLFSDEHGFDSIDSAVGELERIQDRPPHLTRTRRAGILGVMALPGMSVLLLMIAFALSGSLAEEREMLTETVTVGWYVRALEEIGEEPVVVVDRLRREALQVIVANLHAELASNPLFSVLFDPYGEVVGRAAAEHPTITETKLQEAREYLGHPARGIAGAARLAAGAAGWMLRTGEPVMWFLLFAIPSLPLSFVFRGGLLFHFFGIAVHNHSGVRASRWRCLFRCGVAWSPVLAFLPLSLVPAVAVPGAPGAPLVLTAVSSPAVPMILTIVFFLGVGFALFNPERGFQDRIAGTRLVPK